MTELLLLENPRRGKRKRASSHRRKARRVRRVVRVAKRNPVRHRRKRFLKKTVVKQFHSKGTTMAKRHRRHRRHYRKNPGFRSAVRSTGTQAKGLFKDAALGAAGLVVNNFIQPMIAGLLPVTIPGSNLLLPAAVGLTIGKKSAPVRTAATVVLAVELSKLVGGLLPTGTAAPSTPVKGSLGAWDDDSTLPNVSMIFGS